MSLRVPNRYRIRTGPMASTEADGNNGAFLIPYTVPSTARRARDKGIRKITLNVIASDGEGWEHVSVSLLDRCPTWSEMCYIKELFWDTEDTVIQYHPSHSSYINCHPNCLHLWRPLGQDIPCPPSILVGPKTEVQP